MNRNERTAGSADSTLNARDRPDETISPWRMRLPVKKGTLASARASSDERAPNVSDVASRANSASAAAGSATPNETTRLLPSSAPRQAGSRAPKKRFEMMNVIESTYVRADATTI